MDAGMLLNRKQCRQIFAGKALKDYEAERARAQPNTSTLFDDNVLIKANEGAAFFSVDELNELLGITATPTTIPAVVPSGTENFGQTQWATFLGISSNGRATCTDTQGNIYVTGRYTSATIVTLKNVSGNTQTNSTVTLPIASTTAVCLIKYNSSGEVQWATNIDGTGYDIAYGIGIDSVGNIYITGQYVSTSSITLNNASGNSQTPSSVTLPNSRSGLEAVFLVKYNSSGQVQWATNIDGSSTDIGSSIAIDSNDNIYVTGQYTSSTSFFLKNVSGNTQTNSSVELTFTNGGNSAVFIVKYTAAGQVQWATCFGTGANSNGVKIDSTGNVYSIGNYYNSATLKNASGNTQVDSSITLSSPPVGLTGVFLVKYDGLGQAQWATCFNSLSGSQGYGITTDASSNIYISGQYQNSVTLQNANGNGQTASSVTLPTVSSISAFLIKYNSSGQAQWATYVDGTGGDIGTSIVVDTKNNVYCLGYYTSTTAVTLKDVSGTTQTDSLVTLPISVSSSIFLIKYNSVGQVQWATTIDGSGADQAWGMTIDGSGTIYITGTYVANSTVTLKNASGNGQTNSLVTLPTTSSGSFLNLVKYV